jgi:hypothetical protein
VTRLNLKDYCYRFPGKDVNMFFTYENNQDEQRNHDEWDYFHDQFPEKQNQSQTRDVNKISE